MRKRLLTLLLIAIVCSVFIPFLLYNGYLHFNYPSFKEFPIRGIDISHHQGNINWKELEKENISFIFIKATEGGNFKDPKFKENWDHAKSSKYAVGAYHFYSLCKTGTEQADNFIASVPKEPGSLPPVIDLEFGGNCKAEKSKDQVIREIQDYIDKMKDHYGEPPIIYVTTDFYTIYLINNFKECPIWIRDIYSKPKLPDNREWLFWQYANRGHLSGIKGFVDLNVYKGDRIKLRK